MSAFAIDVEEITAATARSPYLSPDGWDAMPHPSLAEGGYAAREYRWRSDARVFRERGGAAGRDRVTTRVLAIAPERDSDFSGVVHIELLNPSTGADYPMFWPDAGFHLMARGDAYLGITCKSVTVEALRRHDPERYAALVLAHDSMVWDLLGAVAAATHLPGAGGLLEGLRTPTKRFATGWSQSGSFLRSYLSEGFHAEHTRELRGGEGRAGNVVSAQIIDGYLIGVSSGGFGPMGYVEIERDGEMSLDATFAPTADLPDVVPLDDRRRTISGVPVPVIEYHSEDEAAHHLWHQRPDSDVPGDLYRCYQVPARGHETGILPTSARRTECALVAEADLDRDDPPLHEGSRWLIAATITHLVQWSDLRLPPRADPIPFEVPRGFVRDPQGVDYTGIKAVCDDDGHALGGMRYLEIDLPLAHMRRLPSGRHIMPPWEHVPFERAEADARYGGRSGYETLARQRAAELTDAGWLLPEHAEEAIRAACARYPTGR